MTLEGYIKEAISSGRYRRGKGIVTDNTTFDEFCETVERCGINWRPEMKRNEHVDKKFLFGLLDRWKYNYDSLEVENGLTFSVTVTNGKCFVLYWNTNTRHKDGPVDAAYYKTTGSGKARIIRDMDDAIDELNRELNPDLF